MWFSKIKRENPKKHSKAEPKMNCYISRSVIPSETGLFKTSLYLFLTKRKNFIHKNSLEVWYRNFGKKDLKLNDKFNPENYAVDSNKIKVFLKKCFLTN